MSVGQGKKFFMLAKLISVYALICQWRFMCN